MEIWDLYDENRCPLNKAHWRNDNMAIGEYHIVVEVWTVNNKNEILLTLRHPDKETYPNFWENTGGSILAGETSKEGAVRELLEETGIEAKEDELYFLGSNKGRNSFYDIYMVRKNVKLSDLKMQEGETIDAQWVELNKFKEMSRAGDIAPPVIERVIPYWKEFQEFLYCSIDIDI